MNNCNKRVTNNICMNIYVWKIHPKYPRIIYRIYFFCCLLSRVMIWWSVTILNNLPYSPFCDIYAFPPPLLYSIFLIIKEPMCNCACIPYLTAINSVCSVILYICWPGLIILGVSFIVSHLSCQLVFLFHIFIDFTEKYGNLCFEIAISFIRIDNLVVSLGFYFGCRV